MDAVRKPRITCSIQNFYGTLFFFFFFFFLPHRRAYGILVSCVGVYVSLCVCVCVCVCARARVRALSRVQLFCDPMDCSVGGSSVHGIILTRILKWVAMTSSRGSSQPRDRTRVSCGPDIAGRFFTAEPLGKPIELAIL